MSKPIIFSATMVRALLDGRKTQTRRIVKPAFGKKHPIVNLAEHGMPQVNYSGRFNDPDSWGYPYAEDGNDMALSWWLDLCPYGGKGDLLWVRENFQPILRNDWHDWKNPDGSGDQANYLTGEGYVPVYTADGGAVEFINSDDELSTRVWPSIHMPRWASRLTLRITEVRVERLNEISIRDSLAEGITHSTMACPRVEYQHLWESINGEGSWDANPWVWALTFEVIKENVDQVRK